MRRNTIAWCGLAAALAWQGPAVLAETKSNSSVDVPTTFSLAALAQEPAKESTGGTMTNWDVEGPVQMRGADVQELGVVDIRFTIDYSTADDQDDDIQSNFRIQYGFMENHELVFKLPINYGDGEAGNVDISLGWQWKFLNEEGWIPAMAIYNEIRLPSGHESSGVDWEIRGIITKTLMDGFRLHLNPFLKVLGGDNIETNHPYGIRNGHNNGGYGRNSSWFWGNRRPVTDREYQIGGIVGMDYMLTDSATINFDYIFDSGTLNGDGMQHQMEAGIDYQLSENQMLAWATRWTLDGDSQGDNWGMAFSYIISLGNIGHATVEMQDATFQYPTLGWQN